MRRVQHSRVSAPSLRRRAAHHTGSTENSPLLMSHCHVPTCGASQWTWPGREPAVASESWGTAAFIADIIVAYVLILVTRYTSRDYADTLPNRWLRMLRR